MVLARKIIRIIYFVFMTITFLIISFVGDLVIGDERKKLAFFSKVASFLAKIALMVLSIKVTAKNIDRLKRGDRNYLIVSNHVSYLDIFVICSIAKSVFVANSELQDEFPMGIVIRYGGGIFVERRNRTTLLKDIENISKVLGMGVNVVLFPESTTSNGESVRPFKTPFLSSALKSRTDIVPICLKYKTVNGEEINIENRDLVFFYGGISFFEHFFRMLNTASITVEVSELETITIDDSSTRKELSNLAHDRISSAYLNG